MEICEKSACGDGFCSLLSECSRLTDAHGNPAAILSRRTALSQSNSFAVLRITEFDLSISAGGIPEGVDDQFSR